MKSDEIREHENYIYEPVDGLRVVANWLQEIAEQLAIMNERSAHAKFDGGDLPVTPGQE